MKRTIILSLAGVAGFVASCSFGPMWSTPEMPVPAEFRGVGVAGSTMADLPWQQVLKDDNLQKLLDAGCVSVACPPRFTPAVPFHSSSASPSDTQGSRVPLASGPVQAWPLLFPKRSMMPAPLLSQCLFPAASFSHYLLCGAFASLHTQGRDHQLLQM